MTKVEIDLARHPGEEVPARIPRPRRHRHLSTFFAWRRRLDARTRHQEPAGGNRQITLVFGTDDVKSVRPHLDDKQAWDVLQQFEAA